MKRAFLGLSWMTVLVLLWGCSESADTVYNAEEYEKQMEKYQQQVADYDRQSLETDRQLEVARKQAERFEQLLTKWEEQAIRQDRILDVQEKSLGIEKESQEPSAEPTP